MANSKIKISRPIVYTVFGAVVVLVVYFFYLQPPPAAPKKTTRTVTTRAAKPNADGITDEDRKARYARYKSAGHDAFLPKVISSNGLHPPGPANASGRGTWVLTGTMALNGDRSALVENSTTQESVFLKAGDRWNGQRVVRVEENFLVLANDKGQEIQLTFPPPPDDKSAGATTASPAPTGGANPVNGVAPGGRRGGNFGNGNGANPATQPGAVGGAPLAAPGRGQ